MANFEMVNGKVIIKPSKLSLGESVVVLKTAMKLYEKDFGLDENGKPNKAYSTYIEYNGTDGYLNLSAHQKVTYESFPLYTLVKITKGAKEIDTVKGKKVVSDYKFENVGTGQPKPRPVVAPVNQPPIVQYSTPVDLGIKPMPQLNEKQQKVLNYYNLTNPKNPDTNIQFEGKVMRIRDILPGDYL